MTCKSLLMVEIRVPNHGTPRIDIGIFLMIMKKRNYITFLDVMNC